MPFPARLGRPEEYVALAQHIVQNEMLNGPVRATPDEASVRSAVQAAVETIGGLQGLINCAGICPASCIVQLWNQAECLPRRWTEVVAKAEEAPHATFEAGNQAGLLELGEMVRDGRLAELEGSREVTHTDRLGCRFEHVQHLHASRIGERLEDSRELVRRRFWQGRLDGHAAALHAAWGQRDFRQRHTTQSN